MEQTHALNQVIADQLDVVLTQMTPDAKFREDLGADSLSSVELTLALEERFNIVIPDEVSERCATVGELYKAIAEILPA